jgi:hypothetical protein
MKGIAFGKVTRSLVVGGSLVLATIIGSTGLIAGAQGVGKMPAPGMVGGPRVQVQTQRVQNWFKRYDQIRRRAQMSISEKARAQRLTTASLSGNPKDVTAAKAMLSSLITRYSNALSAMTSLPRLSETQQVQSAYIRYFRTGKSVFQKLHSAVSSGNKPAMLIAMQQGKSQMSTLDGQAKSIDRKVRKMYRIPAYRG